MFKKGNWIWTKEAHGADTHVEFIDSFEYEGGECRIRISCDGDYTLYINGSFVECNQYCDYEHYKNYDEFSVTPFLKVGKNIIAIHVWYFGESTQRYNAAPPGLIYEVEVGENILSSSGSDILCRKSRTYAEGRKKKVTGQLGFSFYYDATREDDWINGNGSGFENAVITDKKCDFVIRQNEKMRLCDKKVPTSVSVLEVGKHFIVDLGEETVGVPSLELTAEEDGTEILVTFGELLENGHVKRIIASRDFSYEYIAKKGKNVFDHYNLRLGCRFLEIFSSNNIKLEYAGVRPQYYPTVRREVKIESELDRKIYELCVKTLELCMMEHYVDCPWREQCLYALDSRNQMLCGYYAFEGGNYRYARSNLMLMGKAEKVGELLPICSPCGIPLTIPSFGLYYFIELTEYIEYSGDTSIAVEMVEMLENLIGVYLANQKDGLVCRFGSVNNWNFYDWSEYSSGALRNGEQPIPDMMINSLTVKALECLEKICGYCGKGFKYAGEAEKLKTRMREYFFDKKDGYFSMLAGEKQYTEICNSFAVNLGIVNGAEAEHICKAMADKKLVECSLSTRCFRYDAWLKTDSEAYTPIILDEIRRDYGYMLECGATSAWETMKGAKDFDNAGSLCHGWSSIPVYYFHKLGIASY